MGSLFPYNCDSKSELINIIIAESEPLDYEVIGNEMYSLCLTDDRRRYIRVDILYVDDGYGYKTICEEEHPYYYRCPKRILDKSDFEDTSGWRKACAKSRTRKRNAI